MAELLHSDFEVDHYQYNYKLKKKSFYPTDAFIQKLFKHNQDLLNELESIHFLAQKEIENYRDWSELPEFELIKSRVKRKRKSAWFFIFYRYNFKGFRGYVSNRACTAHTVNRFLYGKESQEMLRTIEESWLSYKNEKSESVDAF